MNLKIIRPKNETEDLLLSLTKKFETLIEQTHRKPEETLEFKKFKPRKIFPFTPPVQIKGDWMIGLLGLEVCNCFVNLTEENNNFEIYKDGSNKFGFLEFKDELEEILKISHISQKHLKDEMIRPGNIDEYLKLSQ